MVTCFLKYTIDPFKLDDFEYYGKAWVGLVNKMGGQHHGYLLPYESASDIAYASFSFPSLAAYESYRSDMETSEECQKILNWAKKSDCIIRYERSFMKPVFDAGIVHSG